MATLFCGDGASPFYASCTAMVTLFGQSKSIDEWYYMSLCYGNERTTNRFAWLHEGKFDGKRPTHFEIDGKKFGPENLLAWDSLLWYFYLEEHENLKEFALKHDRFEDVSISVMGRTSSRAIAKYVLEGEQALFDECKDLMWELTSEGAECL